MSETVPGTFQHSMQVANLAAEAAASVLEPKPVSTLQGALAM